MKAIVTTYRGPTDTRGSSITARAEGVRPVRVPYPYDLDVDAAHEFAAHALMKRYGWTGRIIGGGLPDGRSVAWVFASRR